MGAIDGVFQPFFRALQVEMLAAAETTRRDAAADFRRLSDFYGAVLVQARTLARTAFLGEREQKAHPREGWLDRDITMAIKRVKLAWTGNRDYDLSELASALAYVEGRLAMPSVETRWVRAARLAAEAGDDSTTDFEYVYTSQVGSSPVTGAANLRDPTWNYDQLTVPTTRGTHVYSDGEPDLHVVRFKRRVPTGTESGADVGTIAWEQEPAYKP